MAASFAENIRGAGFMVISTLGFSVNDTFIKSVAHELPLFQAVLIRGVFATLFIGAFAYGRGELRLPPGRHDRRMLLQRCLGEIGGTVCFLNALFHMPIANASAILQSVPLAMTLAAALIFREQVGWRRYTAIAVGFLGVLVIVRPGPEGFNAHALWAVAAIGFILLRDLSTRSFSPGIPVLGVVTYTSAALTVTAAGGSLFEDWAPLGPDHILRLALGALALNAGYFAGVMSMRLGDIGFVQPFRYTLLLWAVLLGIIVFGEWPTLHMLVGSAIIVAMGLYTLHRERRLSRTSAA